MTYDPNRPATPEPAPTSSSSASAEPSASSTPASPPPAGPTQTTTFAPHPVQPGAPRVRVQPSRRSATGAWLNVILVVAATVAVGGVAFAIGRSTAPVAAANPGNGLFGDGNFARGSFAPDASGGPGAFFGNGRGGGFNLSGTVQSVTGDTLTITTANGQTLEFTLGADTTYSTQTPATASDVKTGSTVEVQLQPGAGAGALLQPNASGAPSGPVGTASSVTVVP